MVAIAAAMLPAASQAQVTVNSNWVQTATTGPSPRGGASLAYDLLHRKTLLFGGSTDYLSDTWQYDGASWTQVQVTGPSGRYLAPMVYDSARGVSVLFGGYNFFGILSDTWEWDGSTWSRKLTQHTPPARLWTAMAFDSVRHVTVLFGGAPGTGLLNDTWQYDGSDWTQVSTLHSPPARRGHALAFDSARGRTVMFGGQDPNGLNFNDTWEYDGADWTQVTAAHSPPARLWHSMAYDSSLGGTVMFGGANDPNIPFNDGWLYDGADWQQLPPNVNINPRLQAAISYDPNRAELVLFGGAANIAYNPQEGDTWALRGVTTSPLDWAQSTPAAGPSRRVFPAMDYDAARGVTVLFGGSSDGGPGNLQDTWEWNGSSWIQMAPQASPPPLTAHVMAYDSARRVSVLFGGSSTVGGLSSATWEWDGTNWTQRALGTSPPARVWAGMTFDSVRNRIVLFGGDGNGLMGDTWEYDGNAWAQLHPSASPTPRRGPALAFDSTRGRTLLFGGEDASGRLADTWEWNGTSWTQVATSTAPHPRFIASMAFDAERGRTVLFGGDHIQPYALGEENDTWEWDGSQWTRDWTAAAPPRRAGASMSYDLGRGRMVLFGGWDPATSPTTFFGDTWELGAGIQTPPGSPNATLSVGGQGTNFGSVNVGATSPNAAALMLSSTGTGPLSVNSITISGDFAISSTDCPPAGNLLAAGAYCMTLVTFTPTAAGQRTGTLTFTDNAPNGGFTVQFQGNGVLTSTALTVSPAVALFDTSTVITATLLASGSPLAGQPVTLSLPSGSSTTVQTNAQGTATWVGASLAGIHAGMYPTGIQANFAGSPGYAASSASAALTITQPVSLTYPGDFYVADTTSGHVAVTVDQRTAASDPRFIDYASTAAWARFTIVGATSSADLYARVADSTDWSTTGLGVATASLPTLADGAYTVVVTLVDGAGSTTSSTAVAGDDARVGLVSSPVKGGYVSGGGSISDGNFAFQVKPGSTPQGNLVYVYRVRMDVGGGSFRDVDVWATSTEVTSLSGGGQSATATGHFNVRYVDAQTGQRYTAFEFTGGSFQLSAANATNKAPARFGLVLTRPDGSAFHSVGLSPVVLGTLLVHL